MKTKQLRLSTLSEIKAHVPQLTGKKINIVLADNSAMFGKLISANEEGIVLENMRLKKINYPFSQITELYFDTIV